MINRQSPLGRSLQINESTEASTATQIATALSDDCDSQSAVSVFFTTEFTSHSVQPFEDSSTQL